MAGGGLFGGMGQQASNTSGGQTSQSPQYITNQQDAMIRQGFGQLGLAGVGSGPQQINPAIYNQLAQGFATGQINPANFQSQFYNTVQSMAPPAPTPAPTPAPAPVTASNYFNQPFNQYNPMLGMYGNAFAPAPAPASKPLPGMDQVNLGPSQDTMMSRLQDLQLSQISGARPSGERQFYQPVYQEQYQNYASPQTAFGVATYGMDPYSAFDVMNRGYQEFYAPPPSFYMQNPAYTPPPAPSRSTLRQPRGFLGGGPGAGIASLPRSGRR
jgi:hypothetical protein